MLDVPTRPDELDGQPVQQFRVGRRRALGAEVLHRADDAVAELLVPEAVDVDPGRQRVVLVEQPFGQAEAVARQVLGPGQHTGDGLGLHRLSRLVVEAVVQHERGARRGLILHHHDFGDAGGDLVLHLAGVAQGDLGGDDAGIVSQ